MWSQFFHNTEFWIKFNKNYIEAVLDQESLPYPENIYEVLYHKFITLQIDLWIRCNIQPNPTDFEINRGEGQSRWYTSYY